MVNPPSGIATSSLLDTNVSEKEKLYGYHRLEDPPVTYMENGNLKTTQSSNVEKENKKPIGVSGRKDYMKVEKTNGLTPPEPINY